MIDKILPLGRDVTIPDDALFGFELEFSGISITETFEALCSDPDEEVAFLQGYCLSFSGMSGGYFCQAPRYNPLVERPSEVPSVRRNLCGSRNVPLEAAQWDFIRYNWRITTDPTAGVEIQCGPFRWSDRERLRERLESICSRLLDAGAAITPRCGLHIHVDTRTFSAAQISRFCLLSYAVEGLISAAVEPHRYNNRTYNRVRNLHVREIAAARTQHNSNINTAALDEHRTLEFRMFEGTLDAEVVMNWVEMLLRLKTISQEPLGVRLTANSITSVVMPSWKHFRHFIKALGLKGTPLSRWYLSRAKDFWEYHREMWTDSFALTAVEGESVGLQPREVLEWLNSLRVEFQRRGFGKVSYFQGALARLPGNTAAGVMARLADGELDPADILRYLTTAILTTRPGVSVPLTAEALYPIALTICGDPLPLDEEAAVQPLLNCLMTRPAEMGVTGEYYADNVSNYISNLTGHYPRQQPPVGGDSCVAF